MRVVRWIFVLGTVGFLCGFFGPIVLSRANQGPLFGIFLSGPGGAILGAILGTCFALAPVSAQTNARALSIAAAVLGIATLYYCIPSPSNVANIVEGEVMSCMNPRLLEAEAVARVEATDSQRNYRPSKPWSARYDEMLREKPGTVIDFRVHRIKPVFAGRASWNYGDLRAPTWIASNTAARYFAEGFDCNRAAPGEKLTLSVRGGMAWPPADIGQILGLRIAGAVPGKYARFVERP